MIRNILLGVLLMTGTVLLHAEEPETLSIGEQAPDFSLLGIDGRTHTLESFSGARVLTIVFSANHCPTAQAYEERMKKLSADFAPEDMILVAVSSNHPGAVCLEELGYSDLGDSFKEMKIRADYKDYNFPYLYDGENQAMAMAYGARATPHVFVFDQERKLRYRGRIDDMEDPYKQATQLDARNAINAILKGEAVPVESTKAFGCSMKWKSKLDWKATLDDRWKEAPVELEGIDLEAVKALLQNQGDMYRLVNVWATWCGPCVIEFPEIVNMQRMYGGRSFEVISLSMDKVSAREKAAKFLQKQHAAFTNYIWTGDDREALINAMDADWQGNLPYTMLLAPGGEVLYRHDGIIDPLEVKRAVVGALGRYFADD